MTRGTPSHDALGFGEQRPRLWRLLHDLIILVEVGRLGSCPSAVIDQVWNHLLKTGDEAPSATAAAAAAGGQTSVFIAMPAHRMPMADRGAPLPHVLGFVTAFVRNKLWNYGYQVPALHESSNAECGSRYGAQPPARERSVSTAWCHSPLTCPLHATLQLTLCRTLLLAVAWMLAKTDALGLWSRHHAVTVLAQAADQGAIPIPLPEDTRGSVAAKAHVSCLEHVTPMIVFIAMKTPDRRPPLGATESARPQASKLVKLEVAAWAEANRRCLAAVEAAGRNLEARTVVLAKYTQVGEILPAPCMPRFGTDGSLIGGLSPLPS